LLAIERRHHEQPGKQSAPFDHFVEIHKLMARMSTIADRTETIQRGGKQARGIAVGRSTCDSLC
jgi:hypothetical protein